MRRGYARLVADDPDLARQVGLLQAAGCEEVLIEREGGQVARQRLDQYLYDLAPGDEIWTVSFDAFGRTTGKLVVILNELTSKRVTVGVLEPRPVTIGPDSSGTDLELLALLDRHEADRMVERYRSEGGAPRNVRKRALTQAEAAEALARFHAGESLAAIARTLDVDPGAVNQALSGRRKLGETLYKAPGGRPRPRRTTLSTRSGYEIARNTGADGSDE